MMRGMQKSDATMLPDSYCPECHDRPRKGDRPWENIELRRLLPENLPSGAF